MRAPRRRRPRRRQIHVPAGTDLRRIADMVTYEGSREHKDFPRSLASLSRAVTRLSARGTSETSQSSRVGYAQRYEQALQALRGRATFPATLGIG